MRAVGAAAARPAPPGPRQPADPDGRTRRRSWRRRVHWSRRCAATGFAADAAVQGCRLIMWATVGFVAIECASQPPPPARRPAPPAGRRPGGRRPRPSPTKLFALHMRYVIDGVARDADTGASPRPRSEDQAMTIPTLAPTARSSSSPAPGRASAGRWRSASPRPAPTSWCPAAARRLRGGGRLDPRPRPAGPAVACHVGDWDQCQHADRRHGRRVRPHRRARQQRRHRTRAALAQGRHRRSCSTRRSTSTSRARCG